MATKPKEDERKFILDCIEVHHSLPALWNVKSKNYSNRRKNPYVHLLRKYREIFLDAYKSQQIEKLSSLPTKFRN
jgi:hypothetical protein